MTQPLPDLFGVLEKLNHIGASLSSEANLDKLLESILINTQEIVNADGGTLFVVTDQKTLQFSIVCNKTLGLHWGGSGSAPIPFPELPLELDGQPNHNAIAAHCAINKKSINLQDAYLETGFDFSGAKAFDAKMGYRTQSVLAIPLVNHQDKVLAVLQLVNAKDDQGKTIEFGDFQQKLAESLASQASIAMQNRLLINQLEQLFEGLTQLISTAIDQKSPHTAGHCLRVPELTLMLAEAAHRETEGPLADFLMTDKDRYELKIASMLHDCGKITTPVHVVDKATKLEIIFDRIELVEARFENAHQSIDRQALLELWARPQDADAIHARSRQAHESLQDDLDFLKKANIGSERMQAEDVDRIKTIAARTWTHSSGEERPLLTANEVANLTIVAGTLTADEREIINHHIVSTITLLKQLPWPDHLQRVAEFAGGHHERMDGKGYPNGLTRAQMSVQARVMGIADIFEALTASDRPYKKAMPLSQGIAIMRRMKETQHIDPDLFDVFIKHGIYKEYARKYLSPEQIDVE
jgi:HD-GYP domain-containing protein (c-di-GMP phosphodiesterase class II)